MTEQQQSGVTVQAPRDPQSFTRGDVIAIKLAIVGGSLLALAATAAFFVLVVVPGM